MIREPQPMSLVPLNREVLVYEPSYSKEWIRAALVTPRNPTVGRAHFRRWKIISKTGRTVGFAHLGFKPEAWLPFEAKP